MQRNILRALLAIRDPHVLYAKAFLESAGRSLDDNKDGALDWCLAKALSGDLQAAYVSAVLLYFGLFGLPDKDEALRQCEVAAAMSFPPALLLLASFYEEGAAGKPPDATMAYELMLKSAGMGNAAAMHAAAQFLLASGTEAERSNAEKLLRRASDLDYPHAQATLAALLLRESKDSARIEGVSLMQRAAEQDYAHAHHMLGYYYKGGQHGLPRDDARAEEHFARARQLEGQTD